MGGLALKHGTVVFLRGFGQIMLQPSALTGALFLAGICTNSWLLAAGALAGALAGVVTAMLCGFKPAEISQGIYGFNGALVGIALLVFHAPGALCWLLIAAGGALSTLIMRVMLRRAEFLPPFTAPFILAAWAMLALAHSAGIEAAALGRPPSHPGDVFAVFRGLGQVMFQESWIAGAVFSIGLLLHSRQAAAWGVIGSAVGLLAARGLGCPEALLDAGIFGFNGALAGIALGSAFRDNAMMPLAGAVLSAAITRGFQLAGIPALTAPFVLATWAAILADRGWARVCRARS
ncbi:MAG TPA: urea transporter [Planctomycetota bacterium]|nr:urea transporter [Planctomycetota bacterium]OQC20736.1 MAG: Urea transporter [Planctomycetes bacterium ADurb.Bin069]NMD34843.1 urea transporter [Planctomycetota bacterium]HNR98347.1 urea transporter [Planctomycetota bacterium]HOE28941.1 urea transporter [Planctomycetota bacterium]